MLGNKVCDVGGNKMCLLFNYEKKGKPIMAFVIIMEGAIPICVVLLGVLLFVQLVNPQYTE